MSRNLTYKHSNRAWKSPILKEAYSCGSGIKLSLTPASGDNNKNIFDTWDIHIKGEDHGISQFAKSFCWGIIATLELSDLENAQFLGYSVPQALDKLRGFLENDLKDLILFVKFLTPYMEPDDGYEESNGYSKLVEKMKDFQYPQTIYRDSPAYHCNNIVEHCLVLLLKPR